MVVTKDNEKIYRNKSYGNIAMGVDDSDNAQFIKVDADGNQTTIIKNVANNNINPATEEKQNAIIGALGGSVDYDTMVDDYTTTNITYVGKAQIGTNTDLALWQIKRLNETGDYLEIGYADSDSDFDNIWDNRVGLSYSK